ncbi:hypothetical protein [Amycolatopsis sp. PS_44_ISF1]
MTAEVWPVPKMIAPTSAEETSAPKTREPSTARTAVGWRSTVDRFSAR